MNITQEQLKEIVKLEQKKYRNITGKYLIFGEHIVNEAIYRKKVSDILISDENLYKEYSKLGINVYILTKKEKEKFKSLKTIPNIIGICKKEENVILDEKSNILGINKINNPDNLGAILRSAKAFGIKNIVLDQGTADLYNPKTIQAMQGVNFSLNIVETDLYNMCEKYQKEGCDIITTFLDEENEYNINNNKLLKEKKYFIILGNEAQGIEKKFKDIKHINFKINIVYESLNVAQAGTIIMYEISKGIRKE